jgi:uncharacterized iron-regulated membrane protein
MNTELSGATALVVAVVVGVPIVLAGMFGLQRWEARRDRRPARTRRRGRARRRADA